MDMPYSTTITASHSLYFIYKKIKAEYNCYWLSQGRAYMGNKGIGGDIMCVVEGNFQTIPDILEDNTKTFH